MKLHQALDISRGDVVAFIGAGGKTSALINLGHELTGLGWRVVATTTSTISADELELMPWALTPGEGRGMLSLALDEAGMVFLYDRIHGGQVSGPPPEYVTQLLDSVDSDVLLIEADDAAGLPLKAPCAHEPVIPSETTLVVPMASVSVLGQALDEDHVYNPRAMMERYGFNEGQRVKSPWVAQVLRDPCLGLARVPPGARVAALLNQVQARGIGRARARLIARLMLRSPRVERVAIGSVRGSDPVHEVQRPVGAIVLAAGMSSRMGRPKQLLPWTDDVTILEHIIMQLLLARVNHITVVTGHCAAETGRLAQKYDVNVVHNPAHATGEMLSSLQAGLASLPPQIGGALVLLGDQPRITPRIINQVLMGWAEGRGRIVAPVHQGRRGHPILFERRFWQEILELPVGAAPREVLRRQRDELALVEVTNDCILSDVDTPADYQRERRLAGLP